MPEPLILPAPAADCSQAARDRGAAGLQGSSGRPVGVAAILVLIALTAGLLGAGVAYQFRGGFAAAPASPSEAIKAST